MGASSKRWVKRFRWRVSGRGIFLASVIVICLLPIFWTLLASLQVWPDETVTPPHWILKPDLDQYLQVEVLEPNFINELLTSLSLAACVAALTISIAFFAAYGLARSRWRWRKFLVQSFLVLATLPVIAYLVPLSTILDTLHLTNAFSGAMFAEAALYTPLAIYVLTGNFRRLPLDLEEAAYLEGGTVFSILRWIVLPTAIPSLTATAVIVFVLSWNQLLIPLVTTTLLNTLPISLIDFFSYERAFSWQIASAVLIISLLPIGVVVAVAHRILEHFSLGIATDQALDS